MIPDDVEVKANYTGNTIAGPHYDSFLYEEINFFTRYTSQRVSESQTVENALSEANKIWSAIFNR